MAETTSADFIVGLIMGNVVKKPARATCATEGGSDAGAEALLEAAVTVKGCEARVLLKQESISFLEGSPARNKVYLLLNWTKAFYVPINVPTGLVADFLIFHKGAEKLNLLSMVYLPYLVLYLY